MFFQRIKTPGIAHVAYVLGNGGTAAIVDPGRDVDRYLEVLHANEANLRWILETHRQEDFEMGGATLRSATGAEIVAFDHEIMAHADRRLGDGADIDLADGISIRALHTPGHTPESMSFAVTLAESPPTPWGVFTGDALFIGDTGRTDLSDPDKTAENAGILYDQVHEKLFALGDQALVLPAHGAGSACGGNVADRDLSTIGIEKASNTVARMSREQFIRHKANERLARPAYFRLMEEVNLKAGRPMEVRPVPWYSPQEFKRRSRDGIVIDARDVEAYAAGHVPGSYSVWLGGMSRYGGSIAEGSTAVYLVTDGPDTLREARVALARVGCDNVAGALAGGFQSWRNEGRPIDAIGILSAGQLSRGDGFTVLDVREEGEFASGHIPGALNVDVGDLDGQLEDLGLKRDRPIVSTCSVGHRGSLGASILERHGFTSVFNLLGGMTAWQKLDLPLERSGDQPE